MKLKMTKFKLFLIFALVLLHQNVCNAFRTFQVNGVETMLALENEDIRIQCKADTAMAYCGFIHPTGKRFSFSESALDAGTCTLKIKAKEADSGKWRCHIGRKGSIGIEIMQIINVRVVRQLAAVQKNITAVHGKELTIYCATVKRFMPLRYCRFEPPNGQPFSINSDVTNISPILNRYYFPKNKSLDRGDCAVTIRKVKYEDVGTWTCGAGFDDGKEHIDTVMLSVEGLYTMSTASATGVTLGSIGIVAFLAILGFVVWKKRRFLGSTSDEEQELQRLPTPQRSRHASQEVHIPLRSRPPSPRHASQEAIYIPLRPQPQTPQKSPHASIESIHEPLQALLSTHRSRQASQESINEPLRALLTKQRSHKASRESVNEPLESPIAPQRSPAKNVPQLVIDSPSEPSTSPRDP